MDLSLNAIGFLASVSFIAGFVDSIAGGGGLITIPSLLLVGVPPQFALGTNKLSSSLGTGVAVLRFTRQKLIYWPIITLGIGFTLLGSALGSRAILLFDETAARAIILALLPIAALTLFWRRKSRASTEVQQVQLRSIALKTTVLCLGVGFYDGFFGPGTGTFLALGFFSLLHIDLLRATALAKVFNFLSNLGALAVFLLNQKVIFSIAIPMAFANMAGNFIGSHLAIKKGESFIRWVILGVLALLFLTLLYKLTQP